MEMATAFKAPDQLSPHREAAFFYALFLRGHRVESLRRDIDVPEEVFQKWMRASDYESTFRENLQRMYDYRKQVLAIFDSLVASQSLLSRPQ
jgi:hypothetical protein